MEPATRASKITFDEIRSAIDGAPPLQRKLVANRYVGIRVAWDAYFRYGVQNNRLVSVRLTPGPECSLATIWCDVPVNDYPELGVLREGAKLRVSGKIVEADPYITLKDVHLDFFGK